jgi:hypothetical protein
MLFRNLLFWLGVSLPAIVLLCALSLTVDGFGETHMEEDRTVESAGAVSFLIGALLCAIAVLRGAGGAAILVGILSLAAFLSEMSFGERQFGFEAPVIHGVKIDAVHDVLSLSYAAVDDPWLYLLLATVFAALAGGVLAYLVRTSGRIRAIAAHPAMPLAAASLTLIAAAQLPDFGFGSVILWKLFGESGVMFIQRSRFEEAAEFMAAFLLLIAAARLAFPSRRDARRPS